MIIRRELKRKTPSMIISDKSWCEGERMSQVTSRTSHSIWWKLIESIKSSWGILYPRMTFSNSFAPDVYSFAGVAAGGQKWGHIRPNRSRYIQTLASRIKLTSSCCAFGLQQLIYTQSVKWSNHSRSQDVITSTSDELNVDDDDQRGITSLLEA